MKRINKVLLVIFIFSFAPCSAVLANSEDVVAEEQFDWNPVMDAIIEVESNGNRYAKSGNSVGAMQITPILVAECNNILRLRKSKKRYKLSDRFSIKKSKEMFQLIQSYFNPTNNVEKAIRMWNGGVNYSIRRTQRYLERVLNAMH